MNDYLDLLNDAQRAAVVATEGPALVIAGAGSGKTRALTYRIAHLLNLGVRPWKILALTFTNKAAKEMKDRIAQIVGDDIAKNLWMGTFHSIFAKILRRESGLLKYPSNFTIYDTADSKSLIKSILKEIKVDEKNYNAGMVLSRISAAKNDLVLPDAYEGDVSRKMTDKAAKVPLVSEIYKKYMNACFKAGAMDFDDLLLKTNILFRDFPEVLEKYREYFQYILVDEYQDTNFSQYIIINKLAANHRNLCVVGDDAQSIYSFRGARIENILNFANDYPDYKLFKLEQNYRSTQNILNAANSIIEKNTEQIRKVIFSKNEKGDKVKIFSAYSDAEEGYIVVNDMITSVTDFNKNRSKFAVLYRTNAQSRIFEEALRRKNIPYKIYGGLSFYQRKEIKDILAYFRVVINPNDGEALKRIINYPARGIGKTTIDKLEQISTQLDTTLWNVLINHSLSAMGFNQGTVKKLSEFITLINNFALITATEPAFDAATKIITETGILKEYELDKSVENQSRIENIEELLNAINEFTAKRKETGEESSMAHFLEEVSLLTDHDNEKQSDDDTVKLMTIHSAKGLEFENVYIVGVEEGLFPSYMNIDSQSKLEEERRLFYVALTRAKKRAIVSYCKNRYIYGKNTTSQPSRFIKEIDRNFIDTSHSKDAFINPKPSSNKIESNYFGKNNNNNSFYSFKDAELQKPNLKKYDFNNNNLSYSNVKSNSEDEFSVFNKGTKVLHEKYGIGIITEIEGISANRKATIEFKNAGKKQLLLKFAQIKKIK